MEKTRDIKFIFPFCAYIGTVLGVGLYSLPYVMSRSGLWIYLLFLVVVSLLVFLSNLMFSEVVIRTEKQQRFLGYVGTYIGPKAERIFGWVTIIGFWGTFLAYLLVWGEFAHTVFENILPLTSMQFSLIFFVLTFIAIFRGSRTVESIDIVMLIIVGLLLLFLFSLGASYIQSIAFTPSDVTGYILPYGTLMFALWGAGIIPEVVNQLRGHPKKIKKLLIWGKITPVVTGLLFALFISSISGSSTTKEAFEGLTPFLGKTAVIVGSIIGMITISLSYTNLGWVARNMLHFDLGFKKIKAMLAAVLPPLLLLLVGFQNFVILMSIVGAVFLGLQGLMIFALYRKTHTQERRMEPSIIGNVIHPTIIKIGIILFSLGLLVEIGLVIYESVLA